MMRIALLATGVAFTTPALAQDDGFTLSGTARARAELLDEQFRPTADDGGGLWLRTTLKAEYRTGPLELVGEVQDSRTYFVDSGLPPLGTGDVNAIEPIQAYAAVKLGGGAKLTAGRFTMDWGSRRLVARAGFGNVTTSFVGARFDWNPSKGNGATLFWTMPSNRLPKDAASVRDNVVEIDNFRTGVQFFGIHATRAKIAAGVNGEAYAYRLAEEDAPGFATRNRRLWTVGLRAVKPASKNAFDGEIEAVWQSGTTRLSTGAADLNDVPVDAALLRVALGRTFDASWSPRVQVTFDYASGDGSGRTYGRYDTLFGDRVFDFGPTGIFGPIARANLKSAELRFEGKPGKRSDAYVAVRPAWLASSTDSFGGTGVRDASGASGDYAGTQIDARVRRKLMDGKLTLAVGAATLFKGRFLKEAPNAPASGNPHYGFTELSASF
ncbi:alginate export family protein [Sphingomonas suaedae]|uniref:Alginate export family protein n=1 Tax=Sphingomonas suaedae TaxID=2599297 RepID=A0A518RE76_9SPHN|nr:alginate export family protein [Sphingomonas suaedae]QDX25748.1 alginate export family protein [Sphingomonas suaedae]